MAQAVINRGLCPRTHVLALYLPSDVIEMGVAPDVFQAVFAAVHSTNRNSPDEDRLALDLPGFSPDAQGALRMGRKVFVYGSQEALGRVSRDGRLTRAVLSGQAIAQPIRPITDDDGIFGLKRIRQGEKSTPAGLARARRRLEKRGGTWEERPHHGAGMNGGWAGTSFIDMGDNRRVEFIRAPAHLPLNVSTYGMTAA